MRATKPSAGRPITLNVYGPGNACVLSMSSAEGRLSTIRPSVLVPGNRLRAAHSLLYEPALIIVSQKMGHGFENGRSMDCTRQRKQRECQFARMERPGPVA